MLPMAGSFSERTHRVLSLKQIRPLDAAIAVVVVLVVVLGGYLGYSVWAQNVSQRNSSPSARAIAALSAKLRANPDDFDVRMQLAQAYAIAGRDDDAIEQYKVVLKANRNFVPALTGVGFEYLKKKQWKEGEAYFRSVISLTEKDNVATGSSPLETAYFYLGTALMEQRQYEEAAGAFKAALRLRRDSSDASYALAVCYQKLGIMEGYEGSLLYALQFDPGMPEANYDYGVLLLSKNDLAGAAEHFRRSADSAPDVDKPQIELNKLGNAESRFAAAVKLKSSDPAKALVEARIASALDPQSVEALALVGELYEAQKQPEKAAETYRKVLVIDPGNTNAQAGLKRVGNGS
jgi:tetratricopeptide (TPR) repeat protein